MFDPVVEGNQPTRPGSALRAALAQQRGRVAALDRVEHRRAIAGRGGRRRGVRAGEHGRGEGGDEELGDHHAYERYAPGARRESPESLGAGLGLSAEARPAPSAYHRGMTALPRAAVPRLFGWLGALAWLLVGAPIAVASHRAPTLPWWAAGSPRSRSRS